MLAGFDGGLTNMVPRDVHDDSEYSNSCPSSALFLLLNLIVLLLVQFALSAMARLINLRSGENESRARRRRVSGVNHNQQRETLALNHWNSAHI
jgi:hypothetical protein